jgi:hypothetical protein
MRPPGSTGLTAACMLCALMGVRSFFNLKVPAYSQTVQNSPGVTQPTPRSPSKLTSGRELRLPHDTRLIDVVGESHHMPAIERLVTAQGINLSRIDDFDLDNIWLRLIPEPNNPADKRAISVTTAKRELLGYLSRENAAKYVEILTELGRQHDLWCLAQVGGGLKDDGWSIGIWLYMETPGELSKHAGRKAAASVGSLEDKWTVATEIQSDAFLAALAQMELHGLDPDGADRQFSRASLEKAIRAHARSSKALQKAVADFQGAP